MSKKNIARTAIEGGRHPSNRYYEKKGTVRERMAYKHYCSRARFDEETEEPHKNGFDDPWMTGRQVRDFKDKLGPVKSWLEAQVGRPWDKVFSEVTKTFDRRSTAGRHVIEHIEGFVTLPNEPYSWRSRSYRFPGELYVDDHGILRQEPWISRTAWWKKRVAK